MTGRCLETVLACSWNCAEHGLLGATKGISLGMHGYMQAGISCGLLVQVGACRSCRSEACPWKGGVQQANGVTAGSGRQNGHGLLVFGRRDWVQAGEQARRDGPGLDGHAGVAVVGCVLQGPGMAGVGRLVHCRCSIGRAWQGSAMT